MGRYWSIYMCPWPLLWFNIYLFKPNTPHWPLVHELQYKKLGKPFLLLSQTKQNSLSSPIKCFLATSLRLCLKSFEMFKMFTIAFYMEGSFECSIRNIWSSSWFNLSEGDCSQFPQLLPCGSVTLFAHLLTCLFSAKLVMPTHATMAHKCPTCKMTLDDVGFHRIRYNSRCDFCLFTTDII